MRDITAEMVRWIAVGAGILGTGGGGNPYYGQLHVLRLLAGGARVRMVDTAEVPDDALCVSVGGMGAPTISVEKIRRGDEPLVALRALEAHAGRKAGYLISGEIGGSNALWPMVVAAQTGLPVIDGDGMGRAFPELQQNTFSIYGVRCTPAAIADVKHNVVLFGDLADTVTLERYARAVTVQMGGSSGYAFPLMTGRQVKDVAVKRTVTLSCLVGQAVADARRAHRDPVLATLAHTGGDVLFRGKVTDVERRMAATDLAVAAGLADIGDSRLAAHLDRDLVRDGLDAIAVAVAEVVDRMRTSPEPLPVVAVGGGSILIPDKLPGFGEVSRPAHYAVANAIGAAIAQVGGEVDRIFAVGAATRDEVLAAAKGEATGKAIAAGARPDSHQVVEVDEVPLAYLPGNAVRVRVKAVGDLRLTATGPGGGTIR